MSPLSFRTDSVLLKVFDLKGSVRNRLVDTCGKRVDDLVLLDENLLKGDHRAGHKAF